MRTKCGESRKGTASAVPQKSRRRRYLSAEGPGSPANSFAGVGDRSAGAAGATELPSLAPPKPIHPPSTSPHPPILIHLTRTTRKEEPRMSEHHDAPKTHEFHTVHEDPTQGPSNPKEINPKVSSDIAYWSKQFNVTSQVLHEAI